jgi:aminoglycoside phosphotransferase (APT) family kinase protein
MKCAAELPARPHRNPVPHSLSASNCHRQLVHLASPDSRWLTACRSLRTSFSSACTGHLAGKLPGGGLRAGNATRLRCRGWSGSGGSCLGLGILGTEVTVLRGLRHGSSPWLLRAGGREVILRVGRAELAAETATEVAAMNYAARVAGVTLPVAELLGYDLAVRTGYGLVLTACMPGTSVIPPEPDPVRLRALGAVAARISSVKLTPAPALPVRSRPIEAEDFAGMRRDQGAPDLLRAAEVAVARARPGDDRPGLVHGDLWHGNTLWDGDGLTAVLDWDCAGVGPAGIDLGSLRCDAAWCHGVEAAEHILRGWEAEAGRPASDVPYWDAVAALASPPDMGGFPVSMAAQGRPDLTREVMLERRDAFLDAALGRLAAVS